ncbi:receptor-type tyrosine-protein phosphatase gamma-like protein [Lates japonicus]|uniref:Receptor-type tyrosine-protein phosphatase gamma-like protein n=1 Tax=Lates japonicus TaxID=270547 RepID=A0AAD3N0H9_LATJO|nr:receptor-type tyrosine-protein phosphatase gamma-like protein [Lates japonicus]
MEAVISPVSPDVLYLFRVQAVCMNHMRSDFSQSMLFRANTTRIFEEEIRKLECQQSLQPPQPTWLPFPLVIYLTLQASPLLCSMRYTGIGPSSSGSQATVASVVTSTLLAGLGFSGGVISSFPSSVWPSRAPTHNPTSTRQTTEPSKDATASAVTTAAAKDNGEAGGEDRDSCKGQGEDGEREGEDKDEEEEEDEKDEKKEKKGSGRLGQSRVERQDHSHE